MKKTFWAVLAIGALMVGIAGTASATTINYSSTDTSANKTSSYTSLNNFQLETFDNADLGSVASGLDQGWTWTGSASIVNGSQSTYAAPYGLTQADQTRYVTVPNPQSSGSVTVNLGGGIYDYFGLWWGSADAYNTLDFVRNGSVVESWTGSQAMSPYAANGNQTASLTNRYVNFLNLPDFDSFKMTSTQFAFEADNIAVGKVPEPMTMLLMGTGMVGLIAVRRKMEA